MLLHLYYQTAMAAAKDVVLICYEGKQVHVASTLLVEASCNSAFKEILVKAVSERQGSQLAQLPVPDDDGGTWETCIGLLHDPSFPLLSWASLAQVLKLCDNYELRPVLQVCQDRIVYTAFQPVGGRNFADIQKMKLYGTRVSCFNPLGVMRSANEPGKDGDSTAVGIYIDIASVLLNAGLKVAYHAFITAWIQGFYAAAEPSVQAWVPDLTEALSRCLRKELPCPAKYQLAVDLLDMLPGLGNKG